MHQMSRRFAFDYFRVTQGLEGLVALIGKTRSLMPTLYFRERPISIDSIGH